MAKISVCDISNVQIDDEPKHIEIGLVQGDDTVGSIVTYDVSDEIYELWEFAWSTLENRKALFASIKARKKYLEKKGE